LTALRLQRDYVYETQLTDANNNYVRGTLNFPFAVGIKMKPLTDLEVRAQLTYNATQTDYLDNLNSGGTDKYFYTSFSVMYTIAKGRESLSNRIKEYFKDVDFKGMKKEDLDQDGINDFDDECPDSPLGIEVDDKGCAKDSDSDGVPDYQDKEANSAAGAHVDINGVTIPEEMLENPDEASDDEEEGSEVPQAEEEGGN